MINTNKTITSKFFEYKTKLIGRTPNINNKLDSSAVVPQKYQRPLDLPMINCEIELDLLWSKKCVISEISVTTTIAGNPRANLPVPVEQEKTLEQRFK